MTLQTLKVLRSFLNQPRECFAGSEISKQTGMLSGTVYPILLRLEQAGWLESEWETADPVLLSRPRRRLYRLTGLGIGRASAALDELGIRDARLSWAF